MMTATVQIEAPWGRGRRGGVGVLQGDSGWEQTAGRRQAPPPRARGKEATGSVPRGKDAKKLQRGHLRSGFGSCRRRSRRLCTRNAGPGRAVLSLTAVCSLAVTRWPGQVIHNSTCALGNSPERAAGAVRPGSPALPDCCPPVALPGRAPPRAQVCSTGVGWGLLAEVALFYSTGMNEEAG